MAPTGVHAGYSGREPSYSGRHHGLGVADRGYFKIEDIEACEKTGLTPHVPKPQRGSSVRNGLFRKDEFRYDLDHDLTGRRNAIAEP